MRFAVLKGRSNYLCRQRAAEVGGAEQAGLAGMALFDDGGEGGGSAGAAPGAGAPGGSETLDLGRLGGQLRSLIAWAETSPTGDRAELDFEPNPRAWSALSVSARECPGAFRCPSGTICFAEKARERAAAADVVVVNTHLYATHVASDGAVLPEHDVVVLDEAHAVEDVMTEALGVEITAGRVRAVAQAARGLVGADGARFADGVAEVADRLDAVLAPLSGQRVLDTTGRHGLAAASQELAAVLELAGGRLDALAGALRRAEAATGGAGGGGGGDGSDDEGARRNRALLTVGHLGEELSRVLALGDEQVAWVEASGPAGRTPALRAAPIDVGPLLGAAAVAQRHGRADLGDRAPAARDAPRPPAAGNRPPRGGEPVPVRDVRTAVLRQAPARPAPARGAPGPARGAGLADHRRRGAHVGAVHELARHARGRRRPAARPCPSRSSPRATSPRRKLLDAFSSDHAACLFATMSFWQGVDVPGPTLSLVTLDRLPFSRPDDPLLQAAPRPGRPSRLPHGGPPPGRHPAGPGSGPADPVVDRPRRGGRARLAPRHRRLPARPAGGAAAHAAHGGPRRGRGVPAGHRGGRRGRGRSFRSVAESLDHVGTLLPVLLDPHPQLDEGPGR